MLQLAANSKRRLGLAGNILGGRLLAKGNSDVEVAQRGHVQRAVQAHQAGGDEAPASGGAFRNGNLFGEAV